MRYENLLKKSEKPENNNTTAEQIIASATKLFAQKGYHDVTTREIAADAGVNLGLIPYYFVSKENLAITVLKRINTALFKKAAALDMPGLNSAEKLYAVVMIAWHDLEYHPEFSRFHQFYMELLGSGGGGDSPCEVVVELANDVLREYRISIPEMENRAYLIALVGAEQKMAKQKKAGELNISYERILDIILSNYFFNIGLPDEKIACIISRAQKNYPKYIDR